MTGKYEQFISILNIPPAFHDYLDMVATEEEMTLVVALGDKEMTQGDIARIMDISAKALEALLQKAVARSLIKKESRAGQTYYRSSSFYHRVSSLSIDTRWEGVPQEVQESIAQWELEEFVRLNREPARKFLAQPDSPPSLPNQDYLLMEEALEQIDAAQAFALILCDCKAIMGGCDYPEMVCLALNNGAKILIEQNPQCAISKEEAKQVILDSNRAGLMHTGLRAWKEHPDLQWGICNCCTCCCYPLRGGLELDLFKKWPHSHFLAHRDAEACTRCGLCAQRCQFEAFIKTGKGKGAEIHFDPHKCVGCGICATGCPEDAIHMLSLDK